MPDIVSNQVESHYRDQRRNVEINIGKVCNNKCVFCLDGMPTREDHQFMPWDSMQSELTHWREQGHLSVGFLGGEPTTYPQIVEAVAFARDLGYTRIALATNAMMLRRPQFTQRLIDAGLTRVTISMHGHTQMLEDKLTAVPGAFARKCEAIRVLREHRDAGRLRDGLSVNPVLNGWNYRHLPKMMKFFLVEMDLDDMRVNFVRPEGYAEDNANLTPTYTDVVPILMKAIILNEYHFKKTFTFGGVPMCVLPPELLHSPNLLAKYAGDIFRDLSTDCSVRNDGCDFGVAEVENGRSRFNWQDRKRFDLKHHLEGCRECVFTDTCEGVWKGYLDIYGGDEFSPMTVDGATARRAAPRLRVAPTPRPLERKRRRPVRLAVLPPDTE